MEDHVAATAQKTATKQIILFGIGGVLIGLLIGLGVWWSIRPDSTGQSNVAKPNIQTALASAIKPYNIQSSLYYPARLPAGYSFSEESVSVFENNVLTFSITSEGGNTISITEQARPKLIEEVKKTKEFTTPIGSGYIADLEGRTAGFLLTDNALIIASPSKGTVDDRLLSDVLMQMTRL